jgi:hypothetical protein
LRRAASVNLGTDSGPAQPNSKLVVDATYVCERGGERERRPATTHGGFGSFINPLLSSAITQLGLWPYHDGME